MEPLIIKRNCMGSPFVIQAYPDQALQTPERLSVVIGLAFDEIERVESLLTDFRPSPLNEINDNAGIAPVKAPDEIIDLIELARRVSVDSGGAYDISYASVGILWREAFKHGIPPSAEDIQRARALIDYRKIEIDRRCNEVFLPEKGMRIGLGSIGKSYGVDRAFTLLRTMGIRNFFVNGAGDLHVHAASNAPRPWKIGIKNPFRQDDASCGIIALSHGAVVTSGDYERCMQFEGKKYHHIIDARSGQIRGDVASVTICAPTAVEANAYSTAVMALGAFDGAEFLSQRRNVRGLLITSEGKVINSNLYNESEIVQHVLH